MRLIIFLTLLLSSYSGRAAEEPIRTIAGVRATSHEEADKQLPVQVEGTVIYFNDKLEEGSGAMGFVLHDGNSSCWVGSPAAFPNRHQIRARLLYTSDAADDRPCVHLSSRRLIKKKDK